MFLGQGAEPGEFGSHGHSKSCLGSRNLQFPVRFAELGVCPTLCERREPQAGSLLCRPHLGKQGPRMLLTVPRCLGPAQVRSRLKI